MPREINILLMFVMLFIAIQSFAQTKAEIIADLDSEANQFDQYKNKFITTPPSIPNAPVCSPNCSTNAQSNNSNIKITFFDPILAVAEGNPDLNNPTNPGTMTEVSNSSLVGDQYTIRSYKKHKRIPSDENGGDQYFKFKFDLEYLGEKSTLYYIILYQNEKYKNYETIFDPNDYVGFEGMLFKSGENFYGSWGYGQKYGVKSISFTPGTQFHEVIDYFRIDSAPKNESEKTWLFRPRMGDYNFLLVVTDNLSDFDDLEFLIDPSEKYSDNYLSPFYWRNIIGSELTENTAVCESSKELNIQAEITGCNTIETESPENSNCPFIIRDNVNNANSVIFDVVPQFWKFEDFTQIDYNWGATFFKEEELLEIKVDVGRDDNIELDNNGFSLINRKSDPLCNDELSIRRDHAGLKYHQLTYGKYTAQIEFPKMYTKHHIWKGIINTFWASSIKHPLLNACSASQPPEEQANRFEFDFEFFPDNSGCDGDCYPNNEHDPDNQQTQFDESWRNVPEHKDESKVNLVVSNFDYFCNNGVDNFIGNNGSHTVQFENQSFTINRSGSGNTLHIDYSIDDDLLFNDDDNDIVTVEYIIEWTPTYLVFRINGEPFGYFDSSFTRISNFPMNFTIAQHMFNGENPAPDPHIYHHFQFIPFWTEDIRGRVTHFKIE